MSIKSYKGFTIEPSTTMQIFFNGDFIGDYLANHEDDFDLGMDRIDRYIAANSPRATVSVEVSKDELQAIELALYAFDQGLVETEFDISGLRRFVEASKAAHGAGEQS